MKNYYVLYEIINNNDNFFNNEKEILIQSYNKKDIFYKLNKIKEDNYSNLYDICTNLLLNYKKKDILNVIENISKKENYKDDNSFYKLKNYYIKNVKINGSESKEEINNKIESCNIVYKIILNENNKFRLEKQIDECTIEKMLNNKNAKKYYNKEVVKNLIDCIYKKKE